MLHFIETASGWAFTTCCGLTAVSGYVTMARAKGGWRWKEGFWTAPLAFTSATAAALAGLGAVPTGLGTLLSAVPAAAVGVMEAWEWAGTATAHGKLKAARIVLANLLRRLKLGVLYALDDLRYLTGLVRKRPAAPAEAGNAGLPQRLADAIRAVPSLREDGNIGTVPAPADVASGLDAMGVTVSPLWAAVAEHTAEFEPEDKDDLEEHMAEEAAGLLTYAEAVRDRAENLATGRKLHPAYIAALFEYADEVTELASTSAMVSRRLHVVYGDVEDWHEDGGELPEDARGWFGGGAADGAPTA